MAGCSPGPDSPEGEMVRTSRGGVTVVHREGSARTARYILREAAEIEERLEAELGPAAAGGVTIVLIEGEKDASLHPESLPEWFSGAAVPGQRTIYLKTSSAIEHGTADLRRTLAHELTHIHLGSRRLPVWFEEGLAMRMSGEYPLSQRLSLSAAAVRGALPPMGRLGGSFPRDAGAARVAYAASYHFVGRLIHEAGPGALPALLEGLDRGMGFTEAFREAFGVSLAEAEREWRRWLIKRYRTIIFVTGGSTFWMLSALIFTLVYVLKKKQARRKLEAMDEEDGLYT
jgi:hypothetical protein